MRHKKPHNSGRTGGLSNSRMTEFKVSVYNTANLNSLTQSGKVAVVSGLSKSDLEEFLVDAVSANDADSILAGFSLFKKLDEPVRIKALKIAMSSAPDMCLDLVLELQEVEPSAPAEFQEMAKMATIFDRHGPLQKMYSSHAHILDVPRLLTCAVSYGSIDCLRYLDVPDEARLLDGLPYLSSRSDPDCLLVLLEKCFSAKISINKIKETATESLKMAALAGSEKCIEILWPYGDAKGAIAAINLKTENNASAAIQVLRRKHEIESRGSAISNKKGRTAPRTRL